MSERSEYEGRTVVVTGGTGALGSAVVQLLLERGARVRVPCFDVGGYERCGFRDHERAHVVHSVDLANDAAVRQFYAEGGTVWGSIHIAGGFAFTPLAEVDRAVIDQQVRMNTTTSLLCCREAAVHMQGGGRIVNVSARPALDPRQGAQLSPYVVAKAGVAALTQALASELLAQDILVNAIAPSVIDTPSNRDAMAAADFTTWVKPADVAEVIGFLASPRNRVVSGALVPVYGRA
ncbi:MAG: SDR family oxidoreductase [Gammaproteobacteria bacterium]|nr:SDR family oxidoreductase [Gammaproteobacteria bacterium]